MSKESLAISSGKRRPFFLRDGTIFFDIIQFFSYILLTIILELHLRAPHRDHNVVPGNPK